jgi:GNAT superfamily N-acetyltransferase
MASTGQDSHRIIRGYREGDHAAVYDICIRTGDRGADATGKFQDPDLLPDIFAGPYTYLEPSLAFVVDDGERAVGYVLGTADTAGFVRAVRERWLPLLADRYPQPPDVPATIDEEFLAMLWRPERMLFPELAGFPAHLHIDLLPAYQGGGYGRRLVETFFMAAAEAGAPGVHVAVATANAAAHGFYLRIGFEEIPVAGEPGVVYYGYRTRA